MDLIEMLVIKCYLIKKVNKAIFLKELYIAMAGVFGLITVATAAGCIYSLNYSVVCAVPV